MAGLLELMQERQQRLAGARPNSIAGLLGQVGTYPGENLASMARQQISSIPQKFEENQRYQMGLLEKAYPGSTYKSMMTQGDPKALAELAMQVPLNAMIAYHGTPHNIAGKFDISKVGTGEGAQAYGHGMYFAENPAVAKEYQKLDPAGGASLYTRRTFKGQELTPQTPEYHAAHMADKLGVKKAKAEFESWLTNPPDYADESLKSNWQKSLDTLNQVTKKSDFGTLKHEGNLYKVDIPDEYIPNMLEWDKPLKEQPKSVQKALAKIDPDLYSKKGMDYDPEEWGQSIYQRLSQIDMNKNGPFTGASRNVSNMLNSYGIKGIKYNDAGSRNATGGTSNFVVFDPTDVKILEKNSQKVEGLLD